MKKLSFLIILIILIFLTTSCYDYQEPNNITIATALAIDYKDNNYITTIEIASTKEQDNHSYTITSTGKDIKETIENLKQTLPKKLSLSHLEIIIISDNLARNGILPLATYFLNTPEITTNFYLVISLNNSPQEILENKNDAYPINSIAIKYLLQNKNISTKEQFDYQISYILDDTKNITIPTITLKDNNIKLNNLALFQEDKLITYLNEEETNLTYLLTNNSPNYQITINNTNLTITSSKTKINFKNNTYNITLKLNAIIEDYQKEISLNQLKNDTLNQLNHNLINYLEKLKQNNYDILGLKKINKLNHIQDFNNINKNININIKLNLNYKSKLS